MLKFKRIRERGKISFSRYFQELKKGDKIALKLDLSNLESGAFPKRFNGKMGEVVSKQGNAYVVQITDQNKTKKFIVHPSHLKRI